MQVIPDQNFILHLVFTNGEKKLFDCKPYLDLGVFKELKEKKYFERVKVLDGSIAWPNGQDLCPDTLYLKSTHPSS
jgi:hypothetical protein